MDHDPMMLRANAEPHATAPRSGRTGRLVWPARVFAAAAMLVAACAGAPPAAAQTPCTNFAPGLAAGQPIKAVHVTELRACIDAKRALFNLGAYSWTDAVIQPGVTVVKATHIVELRAALAQAYAEANLGEPSYSEAAAQGGPIKALHLAETRTRAVALAGCSYSVSPSSISVGAGATTRNVSVTTGSGCLWEAYTPASWVTIQGGSAGGTGNATIVLVIAENFATSSRNTTLTVSGHVVTIEQEGEDGPGNPNPPPPPPDTPTGSDTISFFHTDALGSVRMVTNTSGGIVARYDFLPFGRDDPDADPNPPISAGQPLRFTGKERDKELTLGGWSLDYFGARYYQSQAGRFTTVDPGHVNGDILDPQSWNGYAYARNNPLKYTDPTGTTYVICAYGSNGMTSSCGSVPDQSFAQLERNPGAGLRLWGGAIFSGNKVVGYYNQTSRDPTFDDFVQLTGALSSRWLREQSTQMAAGAAIAATGGLAAGAFTGGLATSEVLGIGRLAVGVRPSPGQIVQMQKVFARQGRAGVEKALRSLERRLAEHMSKIDSARGAGGYTSSMEREVANFRQLIAAARQVLGK